METAAPKKVNKCKMQIVTTFRNPEGRNVYFHETYLKKRQRKKKRQKMLGRKHRQINTGCRGKQKYKGKSRFGGKKEETEE